LEAIRRLREGGIPAGVAVAPVIPGLNGHEIPAILQAAFARLDSCKLEFANVRSSSLCLASWARSAASLAQKPTIVNRQSNLFNCVL
jgi:DNA repair photolyase